MQNFIKHTQNRLIAHEKQALKRVRITAEQPIGRQIAFNGRSLLCFSSNDYLGLANHPELKSVFQSSIASLGVGAGASHIVCGHHQAHQNLEESVAALLKRDAALFFSNGYMANLAVISSLLTKKDAVFQDKLNHASLIDGGLYSKAHFIRYHHNQSHHLAQKLQQTDADYKLVCSDSVFSMDGDIIDITSMLPVIQQNQALLYLDDAHGFGVLGKHGLGVSDYFDLNQHKLPLLMITLGKAMGCFGALVVGEKSLIEAIMQFGRNYIYTTALPPSLASVAMKALDILQAEPWRRIHLHKLITYFKQQASSLGLPILPSITPIQPIIIGSEAKAMVVQEKLKQHDIMVNAIRYPTVLKNKARLRVALNANHKFSDIDRFLSVLSKINLAQE